VATYGKETKQGVDLAIEEANQSGMLGNRKIEVVYEDDQIDARIGTQAINKLISVDKVPVIIGAFSSRVTLAIAPIAERNKVVLISASATADAIKDAGDYIFRTVPPNHVQGTSAARFALDRLKKKSVAVFYVNDEYGVSLAAEFRKAFEASGGKVLFYEAFAPSQKDFRSAIEKIKQASPEFVYFPGQAGETGLILKQARELGLTVPFIGGDGSYSPDLIKIAGNAAEGSYYTLMALGYGVSDDLIQDFEKRFKAKYGEAPTVYASYAYDTAKIVAKVLSESAYNADDIKKHLYQVKGYKGVTGITSFDQYGEVDKDFYVYQVRGGKFELCREK
jgi:branched-chain amino acid transport system substrate-binding protein